MARPLWSGAISFGLVNIPVKLYTAQREHAIRFHQVHRQTGNRIQNRRVDAETGREVDNDDIVKGYELEDGRWVTFDGDELDELKPRSARTLDIEDFVDIDDVDPIYYDRTYFLGPADDEGGARAYGLLLGAMQDRNRVAIGRVVIRNKQYLAAVRPYEGLLAMSTMHFADEILSPKDAGLGVKAQKADAKTRKLAESLIDALEGDFDPSKYQDTYTDEVHALIERKAEGETIEVDEPEDTSDKVIDLMAALQASVDASRSGRSRSPSRSGKGTKKAARKSAAKRSTKAAGKRSSTKKSAASSKTKGSNRSGTKAAAKKRASKRSKAA